jgi:TolB-like protein/Tfp pilus assembly protein PilF/predicted Ser/Thr protein kinase
MREIRAVDDGEGASDSPTMTNAPKLCRKCSAEIFADAPEGLCTACVFQTGLDLFTGNSGIDDRGPPEKPFPERRKKSNQAKVFADFGDYELLEVIGRGGQGVVYRARQKSLNRTVALKVIGLGHWATEAHLKRFRREAEAAASLDHPGIVPIYEVGERDGSCYFSMKLIEGGQLDQVANRESMPIRRAVELIAKVARTVHYAHDHRILHRDIKPGNILLDQKGEPHLTDFGLARLVETESTVTRTLEVLGTPSYMAPEQAVGNNDGVTGAADVYGLGAVLYQLLTGHPPFAGGTTYETIKMLLDTEPRQPRLWNSKIDRDLSTICLKCLEKDPRRRYSSALALADDLERWLRHEPILARRTGFVTRSGKWIRRNPTSALLAASLVALAAAAGWIVSKSDFTQHPLASGIAVLPFENLGDEKEHAFFADGVQDDILTKLAKIADLKVISRTSVMQYRGKQDVRQIGNALRVSHVLEGTVRRFGGKLHVNAQLVDTRTDEDIWADEYDRNVSEVFAIETEVAQSIINRLRTRVSAREKAAIQERPTKDLAAYDLYVQATSLIDRAALQEGKEQGNDYFQAVESLNRAIARDPAFLLAYCRLALAHDELYFTEIDRTATRLELAKSAINSAFRLQPDSGETHLALAWHLYHGYFDYDRARDELVIAGRALPNNARIFEWSGYIDRRQNRWDDAVRNFERAMELDPRNVKILLGAFAIYNSMREYGKGREICDRLIALKPDEIEYRIRCAGIDLHERADTRPARAAGLHLRLYERDPAVIDQALTELDAPGEDNLDIRGIGGTRFSRAYLRGMLAQRKGDTPSAQAAFTTARVQQEKVVRARPDFGPPLCVLGLIDAGLGRKERALQEGQRAVELTSMAKDYLDYADVLYFQAVICAWTGERHLAIGQLETLARIPAGITYGDIRLNPYWDSLRSDPRFDKVVASLAPK